MSIPFNILLIGMRGSGKSTLGRALAANLHSTFIDLDQLSIIETGSPPNTSIAHIFSTLSEPAFRLAESRALTRALQSSNQVIALGGGTPFAPNAHTLIQSHRSTHSAFVIYLRAKVETLAARLANADNANRPPLLSPTPAPPTPPTTSSSDPAMNPIIAELSSVLASRAQTYEHIADLIVDVENYQSASDLMADLTQRISRL